MKNFICTFCVLLLISFSGCSDGKLVLKGKVTFDGNPVDRGSITFMPINGAGPTDGCDITKGAYSLTLVPGNYKVSITGYEVIETRIIPKDEPGAGQEEEVTKQYIPAKYNAKSTLTLDLKESNTALDYELTSN